MRRLLVLLLAISCGVYAATAMAGFSDGVGNGEGDRARASSCPKGQALVGFHGGEGHPFGLKVVGRIGATCEHGSARTIGKLGTPGHGRRTRTEYHWCPYGTVAIGMRARAGDLVDRVRLICKEISLRRELTGETRLTGSMGGSGGEKKTVRCRPGEYATGFVGSLRGDRDVPDFLKLRCTD